MTEKERIDIGAGLIDQWADALRGDWGSIDGRQCRHQLDQVTGFMRGALPEPSLEDIGICSKGAEGVHWYGDGWDHDCRDN